MLNGLKSDGFGAEKIGQLLEDFFLHVGMLRQIVESPRQHCNNKTRGGLGWHSCTLENERVCSFTCADDLQQETM